MDVPNSLPPYSEETLWEKIKRYALKAGRAVIHHVLLLYGIAKDPDTPMWIRVIIWGALAYFINPFDAIPDITPVVGFSDDLGALAAALAAAQAYAKPEHHEWANERIKEWFGEDGPGEPLQLGDDKKPPPSK